MKSRDKKKQRLSAMQRASTHNVGREFAALSIPNGLNKIAIKEAKRVRWSVVPFVASNKNPLATKHGLVGQDYFERTYWVHAQVGPDNKSYACPARCTQHLPPKKRQRCPICEERAKLAKGKDVDEDLLKSLLPKERQLWLIYDHDETDKGVQLFEASFHGLGKDLDEAIRSSEEGDDYEFFADPEDGFILRISFKEQPTGGAGKWFPPARIDFKARTKPLPEAIVNHGIVVDDIPIVLTYDDLAAVFLQAGPDEDDDADDDDDDDDDRPKKKSVKRPVKDEDADDDDDEEEEEEEEPPRKKKSGKKKKPVDDDDD